ncbi:acyltransferase [Marinifilum sp. D714]|uniref:acyltransferase n=1 Tax=Marinifilum sp. D714 TaxID=2937523 RepID=UPI0027BC011F|nr:acyltransferase [Marinifilum sp. D714]MDQ2178552.1 acyltransferase [Marinifilum sp. D714]
MKVISKIIGRFKAILNWYLFKIAKNWVILNFISKRIRPFLWKLTGVQVKGKISIGYDVYYDVGNATKIIVEEGVWIASRTLLLCHKRDLSNYHIGDDYNKLPTNKNQVILKKGCCVGMGSIVMPGVTIGEGAIVGAGSIVVKDVPAWSIAVGNPAKVVKEIK